MSFIGKYLIILGLVIVIIGLIFTVFPRYLPFGKLPGDIEIKRENFTIYFPLTTSIIISVLLSFILWLINIFSRR